MFSCDCQYGNSSFIENYNNTDYIFQGKVISINNIVLDNNDYKKISFEILMNFKGILKKTITIYTHTLDSACGLGINSVGENWIIWASIYNDRIETDQCTNSILFTNIDAYNLETLKKIKNAKGFNIWYDKEGKKSGEGEYIDNKASGKWIYYINNYIVNEGNYKSGVKDGKWVYYFLPKFTPKENEINIEFINKNYRKIKLIEYFNYGKKDGEYICFSNNGLINYKKNYKKNLLDGISIKYTENGNVNYIYNYKENKLDGMNISFHSNNIVELISFYESGNPIGEWELFDNNGNLLCKSSTKRPIYDSNTKSYRCQD